MQAVVGAVARNEAEGVLAGRRPMMVTKPWTRPHTSSDRPALDDERPGVGPGLR